jgi:hypothetical protein
MKKLKAFPTPLTTQPVNPDERCEFCRFLDCFHEDFLRSIEKLTRQEDDKCFDTYQEIVANYAPRLARTEWIKILGELIARLYVDPGAMGSQPTNPFMITA